MEQGQINPVPIIVGSNQNEGSIFVGAMANLGIVLPLNILNWKSTVKRMFGNESLADTIQDYYSSNQGVFYYDYDKLMSYALRDSGMACMSRVSFQKKINFLSNLLVEKKKLF